MTNMSLILLMLLYYTSSVFSIRMSIGNQSNHECSNNITTLAFGDNLEIKENVCIYIGKPVISISTLVMFDGYTNLTIEGQGATIDCATNKSKHGKDENASVGLFFTNCKGIQLNNFTIAHCSIEDSFSDINNSAFKFRSGLIINNTSYIQISHLTLTKSNGYGAVLINNYKEVNITNSNFTKNRLSERYAHDTMGGSGMIIFVCKCDIADPKYCIKTSLTDHTLYIIKSVVFEKNTQSATKDYNRLFSYGGGLNIVLTLYSFSQQISILETHFISNAAASGGGAGLTLNGETSNHQILIEESKFICNMAKDNSIEDESGGGLQIILHNEQNDEFDGLQFSNITMNMCSFMGNSAVYGGGVALSIDGLRQAVNNYDMKVTRICFKNSTWAFNKALISAAVDISQHNQQQLTKLLSGKPEFRACKFFTSELFQHQTKFNGKATILISRIDTKFEGDNIFEGNRMTGILLISANLYISNNSSMIFKNNTGLKAGGIQLHGNSVIKYGDNVIFDFSYEKCVTLDCGGAMTSFTQDPHLFYSSTTCFIQAANKQARNVTFHFKGSYPNSIFVTSLYPCRHACFKFSNKIIPSSFNPFNNESNNCLGQFYFYDNDLINVKTEAINAIINGAIIAIPGVEQKMPVTFIDDLKQNVTDSTFYYPTIHTHVKRKGTLYASLKVVGQNHFAIAGSPGITGHILLRIEGEHDCKVKINYAIGPCPPGYVIDNSFKCHCSATLDSNQWYDGIIGCNNTDMSIFFLPDFWLGYIGNNENISDRENQLHSGQCPPGYCSMTFSNLGFLDGHFYQLKSNATQKDLSNIMCNKRREGKLCGQCKINTTVFCHSDYFVCQAESKYCNYGLLFYILSELLPLTILFIVVICYNISVTSGAAYSIVFFIQQLHIMEMSVHGITQFENNSFIQAINFFYSIFNLHFFNADIFSFCLWRGATTMDILIMRLASIAYALCLLMLLVLITNKCGRCGRCCKRNKSMVHGLTTFLIMCYSEATHVSFNLLNYETLKGKGGREYPHKIVFINGEMEYFSKDHLFYAIPAIIVVAFIIIPTPLFLTFDPIFLKIEDQLKIFKKCKPWTRLREPFKPLIDSFQSCFKDRLRFFAGLFFLYRTAILANLFIFPNNMQYLFSMQILLIIIFGIHSVAQPFSKKSNNILASFMLVTLLIINTLSTKINTITGNKHYTREVIVLHYFQLSLVNLPVLIGLVWILKALHMKTVQWIKRCCTSRLDEENEVGVSLIYNRNEDMNQYGAANHN